MFTQQTDGCVGPGVVCVVVFRQGVDVFVQLLTPMSPLGLQTHRCARGRNHKRLVFSVDLIDLDLVQSSHRADRKFKIRVLRVNHFQHAETCSRPTL